MINMSIMTVSLRRPDTKLQVTNSKRMRLQMGTKWSGRNDMLW